MNEYNTTDQASDWLQLRGKTVVVTGAGSGVGRATALEFAGVGARTILLDINEPAAAQTSETITRDYGTETMSAQMDVSSEASVAQAVEAIAGFTDHIDACANIAGILRGDVLEKVSAADWNAVLSVDLTGVLLPSRAFKPLMQSGGSFIHVSSVAGSNPVAAGGAYSTAKAGLTMLSRQMAVEWGPEGIRSNTVSPGYLLTAMTEGIYETPGVRERREQRVPMKRIGDVEEISHVILFLASARSSYVTGQDIVVDGALTQTVMSA